jgi:outer membrane protein assembly factor BamB
MSARLVRDMTRAVAQSIVKVCLTLVCAATLLLAQRTLEYDRSVVSQVRIDARDLGYPPVDVIPSGESAITALTVAPDGVVYGATSGVKSHLFALDPLHGYVQPLGYLKDVTTVHGALAIASNGDVYIGGSIAVDNGGAGYDTYPGGHLLRYRPAPDQAAHPIRIDVACETTDLGIPVEHEGIYALAFNRERTVLYGLTYPSGNFFRYDVAGAKFMPLGQVAEHRIRGEKFERDRLIGRALAVDSKGNVFTSGEDGAIFCYRHGAAIEKLAIKVPAEPGREVYNRVEVWSSDASGTLYGGTSDGYLFCLYPDSLTLENLGKPLNQYRINGLVRAHNGKFYGTGGDDDDMARLFSYDPNSGVYQVLGFIDVNRRPYYTWQAYRIGAMSVGTDGTVYLGESERKSRLYLYYPE